MLAMTRIRAPAPSFRREDYQGRTWVTRKGIHVDRMASAWLIRRFIDAAARFKFVPPKGYRPQPGEVRFDMFEAEFTHEGDACTFEVLLRRFGLGRDAGLAQLAEIVHELEHRIERLVALSSGGVLHDDPALSQVSSDGDGGFGLRERVEAFERGIILQALPSGHGSEDSRPVGPRDAVPDVGTPQ